jgi:hypothetical protein
MVSGPAGVITGGQWYRRSVRGGVRATGATGARVVATPDCRRRCARSK